MIPDDDETGHGIYGNYDFNAFRVLGESVGFTIIRRSGQFQLQDGCIDHPLTPTEFLSGLKDWVDKQHVGISVITGGAQ